MRTLSFGVNVQIQRPGNRSYYAVRLCVDWADSHDRRRQECSIDTRILAA
jgi:hypothetical protein